MILRPTRFRSGIVLLVYFAFLVGSVIAQNPKPKGFSLQQNPDQWAQLRNVPEVLAEQKCENWAWAAGIETILRKENIPLDQRFWVDKLNGGAVCDDTPASMEMLSRVIDGDYTLADGRKVRLKSRYIAGAPTSTDSIIVPLAMRRPYILWWNQHAYIVEGAKWNEYIFPSGQKQIEMKEISLLDSFHEGDKRHVKFVTGKDDPNDIGGTFEVLVTPIQDESPWK